MLRPDQETQQTTETEVNPLQLAVDLRKLFRQLDQFGDDELQLAEKLLGHIDQKIACTKQVDFVYLLKDRLSTEDFTSREKYHLAEFRIQKLNQSIAESYFPIECFLFSKESDLDNYYRGNGPIPPLYFFYWVPKEAIILITKAVAQKEKAFLKRSSLHFRAETTYYRREGF
ncbi:hypothetical protein SDC9_115587 [bioreactor metagenome]|jgi:Fe-S-cluster formation regulator IscX/YfhJ|uniref:Uncharacterized protein n=1 Tax=bioreactor metagenome TaxID=1076179 RepID=A0A645BZY1_9ZZZZ